MTSVTDEELVEHFDLERMQRNLEVAEDAPLSEVICDQLWVDMRIALAKVRLLTKELATAGTCKCCDEHPSNCCREWCPKCAIGAK